MFIEMDELLLMVISCMHSVVSGSYSLIFLDVYSETLRNPWNAVSIAAHSIPLSWKLMEEFHNVCPKVVSNAGVIGMRGGLLNLFPCVRLIPRMTRYKRFGWLMSGS